ncbi:RlpA-like double-psi beta-barrel-protein domain-containing protein-containing protein [Geopyxis carbonaria]|nr:RlpA-like double-psi beta-barrel-protein domain-containing protein-containing protein [Geopyxis carbonaria]
MQFSTIITIAASVLAVSAAPVLSKRESGQGTYYATGLGACGVINTEGENVAALSVAKFGNGEHCGKTISVTGPLGTTTAIVTDKCQGCALDDVDMTLIAFKQVAAQADGRVHISWSFL